MKHLFFVLALFVLVGCTSPEVERQQAIARQQEAQSNAVVAQSNAAIAQAQAEAHKFDTLAGAVSGNTPLVIGIVMLGCILLTVLVIVANGAVTIVAEDYRAKRTPPALPAPTIIVQPQMQIPALVAEAARLRGGFAQWDGDAGRWLIVDGQGNVVARQKMLTG